MKTLITCIAALVLLTIVTPAKADVTMTFEEFVGSDRAPISTFYDGVTFTAIVGGDEWVAGDVTTGSYNVSSWPSGTAYGGGWFWIYDNVFGWCEEVTSGGKIEFDNADATYVELGYASASEFSLEAYDAGGIQIDIATGPANLRYIDGNESGPGTLRVDAPIGQYIAYVLVHDNGNQWCVDNVMTDATGIVVPVPGAILLGIFGLSAAGLKLRKFA